MAQVLIHNGLGQSAAEGTDQPVHAACGRERDEQFDLHAGFSTAEKVTNVSGRGVGMDVVKTNIEKIMARSMCTAKRATA
jgi:hypothetical protein